MHVAVTFDDDWRLISRTLTDDEKMLVKSTALRTLESAYAGFDVRFGHDPSAERAIRVESTPDAKPGPGVVALAGAVGVTYPVARVSTVHPDALYFAERASAGCQNIDVCAAKTKQQLLEGLGRGIGATAAHELGHQAGLHFSRDVRCDDCYDGDKATTYVHFFGSKHWSSDALAIMQRVLPSGDPR